MPGADGVTSLWFWPVSSGAEHAQDPRTAVIDSILGDEITITTPDGSVFSAGYRLGDLVDSGHGMTCIGVKSVARRLSA